METRQVDAATQAAVAALERLRDAKEKELGEVLKCLATLRGGALVVGEATKAGPYSGLGAVAAAKQHLAVHGPLSTRELVDGMQAGGWSTTSTRPSASVYSTLTNAPKTFRRTADGNWDLVEEKEEQTTAPHSPRASL